VDARDGVSKTVDRNLMNGTTSEVKNAVRVIVICSTPVATAQRHR